MIKMNELRVKDKVKFKWNDAEYIGDILGKTPKGENYLRIECKDFGSVRIPLENIISKLTHEPIQYKEIPIQKAAPEPKKYELVANNLGLISLSEIELPIEEVRNLLSNQDRRQLILAGTEKEILEKSLNEVLKLFAQFECDDDINKNINDELNKLKEKYQLKINEMI